MRELFQIAPLKCGEIGCFGKGLPDGRRHRVARTLLVYRAGLFRGDKRMTNRNSGTYAFLALVLIACVMFLMT